jgi:helix-turn-helix protein
LNIFARATDTERKSSFYTANFIVSSVSQGNIALEKEINNYIITDSKAQYILANKLGQSNIVIGEMDNFIVIDDEINHVVANGTEMQYAVLAPTRQRAAVLELIP